MEKYFFDIPIFRCTHEKWSKERSKEELDLARKMKGVEAVTEEDLKDAKQWLAPKFSSYRYSELVGMIRVYSMPGQIRAETYFVNNKRLVRNQNNKKWRYVGKLVEFSVYPEMSNQEIYEWTIGKIRKACKASYLKKRYIDLECFETSGPFIDYRSLTNLE